jgi:hypothetical protein
VTVESSQEVTYRDDGSLLSIAASASCEDEDLSYEQRIFAVVSVTRSLMVHAHADLDGLNEKAPDYIPDDIVPPT